MTAPTPGWEFQPDGRDTASTLPTAPTPDCWCDLVNVEPHAAGDHPTETPDAPPTTVSMGDARRIAVEIADQAEAERAAAVTAEAGTPATTPRPDRFRVLDDNRPRLIGRLDYCTCGGNPEVVGAQHEPHCGWDLIGYVDEILPAFAEILAAREAAAEQRGAELERERLNHAARRAHVQDAPPRHWAHVATWIKGSAVAVAVPDTTHEGGPALNTETPDTSAIRSSVTLAGWTPEQWRESCARFKEIMRDGGWTAKEWEAHIRWIKQALS